MTPVRSAYRTILVGVDDSDETRAAVAYAAQLAQETPRAEILLAHAYEQWPAGTHDPTIDRFHDEADAKARAVVDGLADELATLTEAPVRTVVSGGRPGRFLTTLAAEASVVVVGQDTAGLMDRLAFGSVAAHLAANAPCPVVVVPAPWHRKQFGHHPVVVAVSGEDLSPASVEMAMELAEHAQTDVLALHAVPYFVTDDEAEQHERDLTEIVDDARRRRPGTVVTTMIVRGSPDEQVLKQSVNAYATVVGRTQRSGPTAWLRSVAHSLIKRTHCPLIIVPAA